MPNYIEVVNQIGKVAEKVAPEATNRLVNEVATILSESRTPAAVRQIEDALLETTEAHGFKVLLDGKSPFSKSAEAYPLPTQRSDGSWLPGDWIAHKPTPYMEKLVTRRLQLTESNASPHDTEVAGLYIDHSPVTWVELFKNKFKAVPTVYEVQIGDAESLYQFRNMSQFPKRMAESEAGFTAQKIRLLRPVETGENSAAHILKSFELSEQQWRDDAAMLRRQAAVDIPSDHEQATLPIPELQKIALANHAVMTERVKALGSNLPQVAFHGGDSADAAAIDAFWAGTAFDARKRYFAVPTELTKTPEERLTDLTSAMNYASNYARGQGGKIFVFDAAKENLLPQDVRIKFKPSGLVAPFKEQSKNTGEIIRPLGTMDYIGQLDARDLAYPQPPVNLPDYFERCANLDIFILQKRIHKVLSQIEHYVSLRD